MTELDSITFYRFCGIAQNCRNQPVKKPLRLIGDEVDGAKYLVAANSYDLSAEQIAALNFDGT